MLTSKHEIIVKLCMELCKLETLFGTTTKKKQIWNK